VKNTPKLQDLFFAEAARYNVLPLDDRFVEHADVTLRPSYFYGRDYNWFDMERYEVVSEVDVPAGKVELKRHFVNESAIPGGPASVTLFISREQVGAGKFEKQVRGRFSVETLDVCVDALTPVNKAYEHKVPSGAPVASKKCASTLAMGQT
jgi:hypothetical protein